jgi:hypothetical protein
LLKKRWIEIKRSCFTSLAEILIPVLVMSIILILRARIHIKPVPMAGDEFSIMEDEGSLIGQGTNLMPMIDPVEFIRSIVSPENRNKHAEKAFGQINNYFDNFLNQDLLRNSLFFKFHPDNCRRTLNSNSRQLIGLAPSSSPIMQSLARDLELYCKYSFITD